MPKLTVTTPGGTFTIENETVANVGDLLREVAGPLGIAPDAAIAVNGAAATRTTPLATGDRVQTTKAAGNKGI